MAHGVLIVTLPLTIWHISARRYPIVFIPMPKPSLSTMPHHISRANVFPRQKMTSTDYVFTYYRLCLTLSLQVTHICVNYSTVYNDTLVARWLISTFKLILMLFYSFSLRIRFDLKTVDTCGVSNTCTLLYSLLSLALCGKYFYARRFNKVYVHVLACSLLLLLVLQIFACPLEMSQSTALVTPTTAMENN